MTDLIKDNHKIKELSMIPINCIMLCLICSDEEIIKTFENHINVCKLYDAVMKWLSKRYMNKMIFGKNEKDGTDIKTNENNILLILKLIAYNNFTNSEKYIISGNEIDLMCNEINKNKMKDDKIGIQELYEYGLLKSNSNIKL